MTYDNPELNAAVTRAFAAQDPKADWQRSQQDRHRGSGLVPAASSGSSRCPPPDRVHQLTWQSLGNSGDITNIAVTG